MSFIVPAHTMYTMSVACEWVGIGLNNDSASTLRRHNGVQQGGVVERWIVTAGGARGWDVIW